MNNWTASARQVKVFTCLPRICADGFWHSIQRPMCATLQHHDPGHAPVRSAFTLIELPVVIAIIATLASMLLPVLVAAKKRATVAACLSNQRQLALAWTLYCSDNSETMPTDWFNGNYMDGGGYWAGPVPWTMFTSDMSVD